MNECNRCNGKEGKKDRNGNIVKFYKSRKTYCVRCQRIIDSERQEQKGLGNENIRGRKGMVGLQCIKKNISFIPSEDELVCIKI